MVSPYPLIADQQDLAARDAHARPRRGRDPRQLAASGLGLVPPLVFNPAGIPLTPREQVLRQREMRVGMVVVQSDGANKTRDRLLPIIEVGEDER